MEVDRQSLEVQRVHVNEAINSTRNSLASGHSDMIEQIAGIQHQTREAAQQQVQLAAQVRAAAIRRSESASMLRDANDTCRALTNSIAKWDHASPGAPQRIVRNSEKFAPAGGPYNYTSRGSFDLRGTGFSMRVGAPAFVSRYTQPITSPEDDRAGAAAAQPAAAQPAASALSFDATTPTDQQRLRSADPDRADNHARALSVVPRPSRPSSPVLLLTPAQQRHLESGWYPRGSSPAQPETWTPSTPSSSRLIQSSQPAPPHQQQQQNQQQHHVQLSRHGSRAASRGGSACHTPRGVSPTLQAVGATVHHGTGRSGSSRSSSSAGQWE
jgi:hypothetical protein